MRKYDYLLFDLDNTLFDFTKAEYIAFKNTADHFGLEYSEELYSLYSEINDRQWKRLERGEITLDFLKIERFRLLLLELGNTENEETYKMATEMRDKYMHELSRQTCLIENADEVCHALAKEYRMFVITNGISMIQRSRIALSTLGDCFEDIFISEELGATKPSEAYFDVVLDKIGSSDRSKYLVIGDSLTSDCDGAIRYGIDVCRYNPAGKSDEGRVLTYSIKNLTELYSVLGV